MGWWFLILKALRVAERRRVGKDPQPTAANLDSQSVKTVEESAHPSGYDAHNNVKGRKCHLLVATLGLPLSIYVTSANVHVQDRVGAQYLLAGLKMLLPRLKTIWADGAYTGEKLVPPYNVVLLGNAHSFEYVIRMLKALFGRPPERGYRMVGEVHTTGRAVP